MSAPGICGNYVTMLKDRNDIPSIAAGEKVILDWFGLNTDKKENPVFLPRI
jgi:hypothetical protein